jgi:hypothetical protein
LTGGVIGTILFAIFFDWSLIILSSLSGAVILAQSIFLPRDFGFFLIAGLFIVGIIVQARTLASEQGE